MRTLQTRRLLAHCAIVASMGCGDDSTGHVDAETETSTNGTTGSPQSTSTAADPASSNAEGSTDSGAESSSETGSTSLGTSTGDTPTGGSTSGDSSSTDSSTTGPDSSCVDIDIGSQLGASVVTATVDGLGMDIEHSCSPLVGEDHVSAFVAPFTGVFVFSIAQHDSSFHSAIAVIEDHCGGRHIGCNEELAGIYAGGRHHWSEVTVALEEDQAVLVAVLAPPGEVFDLDIEGHEVLPDESCIGEDLGNALGVGIAAGTGPQTLLWTAPDTATFVFSTGQSGGNGLVLYLPGCGQPGGPPTLAEAPTLTGPIDPIPRAVQSLDLVAGQTIAIDVEVYAESPDYELSITQNTTAGGTCCSPHAQGGCDDPGIDADVCAADLYCCVMHWDLNCSNAARFAYDANCISD